VGRRPVGPGRRLLRACLVALVAASLACGTLLYPERRGLEDADHIDPVVVLLDGALLLLFIVPGVVAFAVDIATGAIYEPEEDVWLRREGEARVVTLTPDQARRLQVRSRDARGCGAIRWETPEGERVPLVRSRTDGEADVCRLEPDRVLRAGRHRLVVSTEDGSHHGIPVTLL